MDAPEGPQPEDGPYLYLSYAEKDASIAGSLSGALQARGIRVSDRYIAPVSGALPAPADNAAELRDAAAVLVVWSGLSSDSSEAGYDAAQADDRMPTCGLRSATRSSESSRACSRRRRHRRTTRTGMARKR
jgi:hypothetical protein